MHIPRSLAVPVIALTAIALTACSTTDADDTAARGSSTDGTFPITIEHAYGETVITEKPERVATVAWANQDVALALDIVPVGMAAQTWGVEDGSGILPWTAAKLDELGAQTPVLFDETDGIDFEAVANTDPDLILATYSGITEDEYNTLSAIAPTIAFPHSAWTTTWREMIRLSSQALGLADEGDQLINDLETQLADAVATQPALVGKTAAFFYINTADLSSVGVYTTGDPRSAFLGDLDLAEPSSVAELSAGNDSFYYDISAENIDSIADVDILVTYGDDTTLAALQSDPLISTLPAVAKGAVVVVGNGDAFSAATNPTPLAIPYALDEYVAMLGTAAEKADS